MDRSEEDDDLKLVKASAVLLSDLETAIPKLLWKPSKNGLNHGRVHSRVKKQDLDFIIKLVRTSTMQGPWTGIEYFNRLNHFKVNLSCSMLG